MNRGLPSLGPSIGEGRKTMRVQVLHRPLQIGSAVPEQFHKLLFGGPP